MKEIIYVYTTETYKNKNWYKIGMTNQESGSVRISQQDGTSNPEKLEKQYEMNISGETELTAYEVEQKIHQYYTRLGKRVRDNRQWFEVEGGIDEIKRAIESILDNSDLHKSEIKLKPHQIEANIKINECFNSDDKRCLLAHKPRSGKTFTTIYNIKENDYKNVVILTSYPILNFQWEEVILGFKGFSNTEIIIGSGIFDNIDNLIVDSSVPNSIKNTITETFNKSKKENDWISINMVSLKIIEPLLREFFIKNNWLYKKSNLKNKTLSELLDTKDFRDKYPNICNGLKMILCDYLGLNLRNNEFQNLTENSSNPIICKISFICISSILDLFEDINIDKYYKISKSKIETNDYKPLKNDINPHLEAINYLQWEFMSDRNDSRIDRVFQDICIPNNINQGELDIDFSKYSVEEFLREIMKLKN